MKKIFSIVLLLALALGGLSAQAKPNSETKVFALELGTGFNYDLGAKATNATQTFAADFGLNDTVQAGFLVIKGNVAAANAHNFALVKVAVYPIADLLVSLMMGADGTNAYAGGLGLGYNVLRNSSNGLNTALQVNAQYLFADPANGNLGFGLNLKIGL